MESFHVSSLSIDDIRLILQELEGEADLDDDLETVRAQLVHLIQSPDSPDLATIALIPTLKPSRSPWLNKSDGQLSQGLGYLEKGLTKGGHLGEPPSAYNSAVIDGFVTFFKLLCLSFDSHYVSGWNYHDWSLFSGVLTYNLFDMVDSDWEKSAELSTLKMKYWDAVLKVADIETDSPYLHNLKIGDLFKGVTEEISDLIGFECVEEFICLTCHGSRGLGENPTEPASSVDIPVPFNHIFHDWFGSTHVCTQSDCQVDATHGEHQASVRRVVVTSDLPGLLFVLLPAGKVKGFKSTPRRCTFSYHSSKYGPEVATFGWLGTVCQKSAQHCRVYWHHEDPSTVLQYDSLIGPQVQRVDTRVADPDDTIPEEWAMHGGLVVFQRLYRDGPPRSEMVARALFK